MIRPIMITLPALGVAFAAIFVWLGVRILNRRERWAMLTAAAMVGLPVLYIVSFGPACWVSSREENVQPVPILPLIYLPFTYSVDDSGQLNGLLLRFAAIGMRQDRAVRLPQSTRWNIYICAADPPRLIRWKHIPGGWELIN